LKKKKADIIIVDLPNVIPLIPENVYGPIITTAIGRSVETSIIDGKLVMERRKVLTTDLEEAMKKGKETSLDIWNRNKVNLENGLLCEKHH
jgi:cytosine/adenosine deaminase-related metal-dependent hydrolase